MAKNNQLLYLGVAAIGAYFLIPSVKKAVDSALSGLNPLNGVGGALGELTSAAGGAAQGAASAAGGAAQGAASASKNLVADAQQAVVSAGGAVNTVFNASRYQNLAPGAAQVVANTDFINQTLGQQLITATITPTTSGSGLINLRPNASLQGGNMNVAGNAAIDLAVAASKNSYGVELKTGGTNVFNITNQGKAATTAYSSPMAIASAMARGLF